jgi:hypothetical protein
MLGVGLPAGRAAAQPRGDVGESCLARRDCREGLRCIQNTCRKPTSPRCNQTIDCPGDLECLDGRCQTPAKKPRTRTKTGWTDFELGGTRFFAGVTLAPGLTGFWNYGSSLSANAAFFFALRLGLMFDITELALEVAPNTWVRSFNPDVNSFSLLASIGGLIPVSRRAFWPMRFGLGFSAGNLPLQDVYMQGRLDIIGVGYQFGHLLFEVNLPSTRFHTEFRDIGIWAWLFTISVTYVL